MLNKYIKLSVSRWIRCSTVRISRNQKLATTDIKFMYRGAVKSPVLDK
uniref:Uncharacterized protein n=1 Tax=Arundo donax TaxID=35708 RepID=A0A0A9BU58_ARUDO